VENGFFAFLGPKLEIDHYPPNHTDVSVDCIWISRFSSFYSFHSDIWTPRDGLHRFDALLLGSIQMGGNLHEHPTREMDANQSIYTEQYP